MSSSAEPDQYQPVKKPHRYVRCGKGFKTHLGSLINHQHIHSSSVEKVLEQNKHRQDGCLHNLARAMKKDPVKQIFVRGLNPEVTKDTIREYFEAFGEIKTIKLPINWKSKKGRGFILITYTDEASAKTCLQQKYHNIQGSRCELEIARPKEQQFKARHGSGGYGGRRGRGCGKKKEASETETESVKAEESEYEDHPEILYIHWFHCTSPIPGLKEH